MTRMLSEEVMGVLDEQRADNGPISLAFLARRFGVSSALMASCAQQLVSSGSATPTMATHRGVQMIQGLVSQRIATAPTA
ncbi:MAG: hypothetical protein JWM76_3423 [Pseudonocardiales bacterium]|nr:hypothetical protein [Pseudonocardiales bacterium]